MTLNTTAWNSPFSRLLQEGCPRWAKTAGEAQLTVEPLHVDDVIEVWVDCHRDPEDRGTTLRGMWRFIPVVGLLEYKSVVSPFEPGDLSRLFAYGLLWRTTQKRRESCSESSRTARLAAHEITLILAVPSINELLCDELAELGLTLSASTTGYYQVAGSLFPLMVIDLRAVAELEDDDLLRRFAGSPQRSVVARHWMRQHWSGAGAVTGTNATPDLFGYDEYTKQYFGNLSPEERLEGLAPEDRLRGLDPEDRLQDLTEAEQVLALPAHLLRLLPDDYIATLPADVRAKVCARRESGS